MKIAISFTITLENLHEKKVALVDIDEFHVGCRREHLFPAFPDHNKVPFEVSWLNKGKLKGGMKSQHGETGNVIDPSLCEPEALKTWDTLRQWMSEKDTEGKVKYSVGNYPALCAKFLREGHEVWYWGEWQELERWSHISTDSLV